MRRFLRLLAIALVATVPALVFRVVGLRPGPVIDMAVFGIAILAAGFMLSWGAEAAEKRISQGLILALVALITVLPEYAVDLYYAYEAGKAPQSNYVHYAAANMTGANRLLIGVAWPLLLAVSWARTRKRHIALATVSIIDVGFLLLAMQPSSGPLDLPGAPHPAPRSSGEPSGRHFDPWSDPRSCFSAISRCPMLSVSSRV